MDKLKAINTILPALGESVITSVTSKNPTVKVILNAISVECTTLQMREWWFNTFDVELLPDNTGEVLLPSNTLSWLSYSNEGVQRGNKVYNPTEGNFQWEQGVVHKGQLRVEVDFEELPESAANVVLNAAAIKAYTDDIGLEDVIGLWQQREMQARVYLESEHLRNRRYTTKRSRRYRNIRRAIGR